MTQIDLFEFSDQKLAELATHAAELRELFVWRAQYFDVPAVRLLDLRRLTKLHVSICFDIRDYSWWNGFEALQSLSVELFDEHTLQAIAHAPWCDRLEAVQLMKFYPSPGADWRSGWQGQSVQWKSLRLSDRKLLQALLADLSLPALERLELYSFWFSAGEFCEMLSEINLPTLTELDVHSDEVTGTDVIQFLESPRPGLPNLQRLYVTLPSENRIGYEDGWYDNSPVKYYPLSPAEFEALYLKRYGLAALPQE